jgi:hypothetical protein
MTTALFFIIGAILATIGTVGAFISYFRSENHIVGYLAHVFLAMALHAFAFSLPILITPNNPRFIAYGYILGILLVYILLVLALRVQTFITLKFFKKYANLISIVIAVIGVNVISVLVYDLRLPIINGHGIVFWNANPIASIVTGVVCFTYGVVWMYLFYLASNLTRNTFSKIKLLVLSADGLLFGTGALFIYTSNIEMQSVIGMVLFITACIITAPIFVLPKNSF